MFGRLRDLLIEAIIIFATLLCGSIAIVASFFETRGRVADAMTRLFARTVAIACGMKIVAEGVEHIDPQQSYVVVANHRSHLDSVALTLTCPAPLRMLAKEVLFRVPLFGTAIRRIGHIPVYRGENGNDMNQLVLATRELVQRKHSLCVYAEGARQKTRRIAEFKRGAFIIARASGLPILPVSITGTEAILPTKTLHFTPGTAHVRFHPPMQTETKDVEKLRAKAQKTITAGCRELDKR
ncbi:MAG TPA: lysophospholipid acyltransferase family protein [bacterium]|nr:lysophospholipid acyltransferase family protein [bacterium]